MHADLIRALGLTRLYDGCDDAPENLLDACTADLRPFFDGKDRELRRILNGVLYNLKHERDHVFWWVNRLIERQRGATGEPVFQGKQNPLGALWRLLEGFAEKREGLWQKKPAAYPAHFGRVGEVLAVLKEWYETMTHREKPIYLYHALLLIVRRRQIDWEAQPPPIDTPPEQVEALYEGNLAGPAPELDAFVHDMHTGASGPDARTRFALEGAFVVNEDVRLRNDVYRTIYCRLKEWLDVYEERGLDGVKALGGRV
jgi:hypothetical protein